MKDNRHGMLILTRRPMEEVDITVPPQLTKTPIRVVILGVKGNQVRIGFEAARDVVIDRSEITERKRADAEGNQGANGNVAPAH